MRLKGTYIKMLRVLSLPVYLKKRYRSGARDTGPTNVSKVSSKHNAAKFSVAP